MCDIILRDFKRENMFFDPDFTNSEFRTLQEVQSLVIAKDGIELI